MRGIVCDFECIGIDPAGKVDVSNEVAVAFQ